MDPTTLRLPADTLAELDSEYTDYGYTSRSDYVRAIIEHRDPPFEDDATTPATTRDYERPDTNDYERLRDRVADLEARVEELEGGDGPTPAADIEVPADPVSKPDPYGQRCQEAVAVLRRADRPLQKGAIMSAVGDEDITDDSLWRRHIRPAIKEAGAELDGRRWTFDE